MFSQYSLVSHYYLIIFSSIDSVYCVAINKIHSNIVASGGGDDIAYIYHLNTNVVFPCKGKLTFDSLFFRENIIFQHTHTHTH
jgi:hypothetical protein